MQKAEFREQSTTPSSIDPNITVLYSDASNLLYTIASGGVPVQIGTQYTGVVPQNSIQTAGQLNTGICFGNTNSNLPQTGLGTPSRWFYVRQGGTDYAIPGYTIA